jgi:hypothetical protein
VRTIGGGAAGDDDEVVGDGRSLAHIGKFEEAGTMSTNFGRELRRQTAGSGSRGGAGLFSWDSVKTDVQKGNYLGHSIMAPGGPKRGHKQCVVHAAAGLPAD